MNKSGLHLVVSNLRGAREATGLAGGPVINPSTEAALDVMIVGVIDTAAQHLRFAPSQNDSPYLSGPEPGR